MEKVAFYGIHITVKTGGNKITQYQTEMTIIEFFSHCVFYNFMSPTVLTHGLAHTALSVLGSGHHRYKFNNTISHCNLLHIVEILEVGAKQ